MPHLDPLKADPTRTTTLRREFVAEVNRRFAALKKLVFELIVTNDVFGLKDSGRLLELNQLPEPRAWEFLTDSGKISSFNLWFQNEINQNILAVEGELAQPWTSKYVDSAYRKGSIRAYTDAKKETLASSQDFYSGSKAQFLESAFAQPERISKLQFLFTRTFEELKGVTAAMSQQMSRVLAQGIANGLGAEAMARNLNNTIDGITIQRARTLARTEVIAAHAEGQLDSMEDLGIEEVGVMVEWSTAGDSRVCPQCAALEGTVLKIQEARGLIPRHPNCRCSFLPANVGEKINFDKAGKGAEDAIEKSVQAQFPKETLAKALSRSRWQGVKRKITPPTKTQRRLGELLADDDAKLVIPPRGQPGSKLDPDLEKK